MEPDPLVLLPSTADDKQTPTNSRPTTPCQELSSGKSAAVSSSGGSGSSGGGWLSLPKRLLSFGSSSTKAGLAPTSLDLPIPGGALKIVDSGNNEASVDTTLDSEVRTISINGCTPVDDAKPAVNGKAESPVDDRLGEEAGKLSKLRHSSGEPDYDKTPLAANGPTCDSLTASLPDGRVVISGQKLREKTKYRAAVLSKEMRNKLNEDPSELLPKKICSSGLLRMFECELFTTSMAMTYLFKTKEPGVQSYIANKLFDFEPSEVDFFLPQLVSLYVAIRDLAEALHPYILYRCRNSVDFSLKTLWLLSAFTHQEPSGRKASCRRNQQGQKLKDQLLNEEIRPTLSKPEPTCSDSSNLNRPSMIRAVPAKAGHRRSSSNDYNISSAGTGVDTQTTNLTLTTGSNREEPRPKTITTSTSLSEPKRPRGAAGRPAVSHQRCWSDVAVEQIPVEKRAETVAPVEGRSNLSESSSCGGGSSTRLEMVRTALKNTAVNGEMAGRFGRRISSVSTLGNLSSGKAFDNGCVCYSELRGIVDEWRGRKTVCSCAAPRLAANLRFVDVLMNISKRMQNLSSREQKAERLIAELSVLNLNLPDRIWLCLYDELVHRVVRIPPNHATLLNSKDKAPYLIYVEVLQYERSIYDNGTAPKPHKISENSLRHSRSEDNLSTSIDNSHLLNGLIPSPLQPSLMAQTSTFYKDVASHVDKSQPTTVTGAMPVNPFRTAPQLSRTVTMPAGPAAVAASSTTSAPSADDRSSPVRQQHARHSPVEASDGEAEVAGNLPSQACSDGGSFYMEDSEDAWSLDPSDMPSEFPSVYVVSDVRNGSGGGDSRPLFQRSPDSFSVLSADSLASVESRETVFNAGDIRRRLANYVETSSGKSSRRFRLDPEDPSAAVMKEPFREKERRIMESSQYGQLYGRHDYNSVVDATMDGIEEIAEPTTPSAVQKKLPIWRLLPVIVKCGDDLRQELLVYQVLKTLQDIWAEEKIPLWVRPFRILVTGPDCGMIEPVLDAVSLSQIHKQNYQHLLEYFERQYQDFDEAQRNFVKSCAAYSVVCYLMQVKDRHNGNILIDDEGHVIHIDFGFILSQSPGRNIAFEQSPFKLTNGFVDVMGGLDSDMFRYYKILILKGLVAARKHMERIVQLVEILQASAGSDLPCFAGNKGNSTIRALKDRFHLNSTEEGLHELVDTMVKNCVNSITTSAYDRFQYYSSNIYY